MKKLIFAVLFALAGSAGAATNLTASCTAPTTRTSGVALAPSEIANYQSFYQLAGGTEQGPFVQTACSYSLPIAEGACIKAGAIFSVTATDTGGLVSDRATVTLAGDACRPKSSPSAPTSFKVVVQ